MDDLRVGRVLRALRHRLGWRQADVAVAAALTRHDISRGELGRMHDVRKLRRHAVALGADVAVSIRWRGGEVDRLLDRGHAALASAVARMLLELGWEVHPEVSYSIWGERGSIDLLAWHAETRTLLVIEIKTELTSVEATLRKLDEKVRLAPRIAAERFGWQVGHHGHLLVLPAASTPRRHVARHAPLLDRAFPLRGPALRRWLRRPAGGTGGILFVPFARSTRVTREDVSRRRVRGPAARGAATNTRVSDAPGAHVTQKRDLRVFSAHGPRR
jgi:transcriptional regulator with XRE-family HTH domain